MDYQKYRQSLNQKLAKKVQCELADFREDILSKSPQEIYDAAYQIILHCQPSCSPGPSNFRLPIDCIWTLFATSLNESTRTFG